MLQLRVSALAALAPCPAAFAHHGFGTFELSRELTVRGVVTGVDFVNPHSWVYLDVTAEDGRVNSASRARFT